MGIRTTDAMSVTGLGLEILDDFHDWVDGDDWVASAHHAGIPNSDNYRVIVEFASGKTFEVNIKEFTE